MIVHFFSEQHIQIIFFLGPRHSKPKEEDLEGFQPAMMTFKVFMQTQVVGHLSLLSPRHFRKHNSKILRVTNPKFWNNMSENYFKSYLFFFFEEKVLNRKLGPRKV